RVVMQTGPWEVRLRFPRGGDRVRTVCALALTTDGRRVASEGEDDIVRVWEISSGRILARMDHESDVSGSCWVALEFDPLGLSLASAKGREIWLWNTANWRPRAYEVVE